MSTHGSLLGYKKYLPSGGVQIPYKMYDRLTFKTTAKRADAIVVSSQFEYQNALEFGINPKKIHIIPMGIDCNFSTAGKVHSADRPLQILFVGRLARVRRVELLFKAIKMVDIPWHATIIGGEEETSSLLKSGYLAELKTLCSELEIENKVTFKGPQSAQEVRQSYLRGDVFVYLSRYENFGQPILEAAASGLPVISTKVGIARDLIENGKTGFIVSEEPGEIAGRIKELASYETRKQMGTAIQKRVEKFFDWHKIIQDYKNLYESF